MLHFLAQRVVYGAARAALGTQLVTESSKSKEMGRPTVRHGKLALGNLEIVRDWGYAGDFVRAMWLMLQQECPVKFVIGTGQLHTLKDLCAITYDCVGKDRRKKC